MNTRTPTREELHAWAKGTCKDRTKAQAEQVIETNEDGRQFVLTKISKTDSRERHERTQYQVTGIVV